MTHTYNRTMYIVGGSSCTKGKNPTFVTVGARKGRRDNVYPTINGGMQNVSLVGIYTVYTLHTHFCTVDANFYAQSVLIVKDFCTVAQSEVH